MHPKIVEEGKVECPFGETLRAKFHAVVAPIEEQMQIQHDSKNIIAK